MMNQLYLLHLKRFIVFLLVLIIAITWNGQVFPLPALAQGGTCAENLTEADCALFEAASQNTYTSLNINNLTGRFTLSADDERLLIDLQDISGPFVLDLRDISSLALDWVVGNLTVSAPDEAESFSLRGAKLRVVDDTLYSYEPISQEWSSEPLELGDLNSAEFNEFLTALESLNAFAITPTNPFWKSNLAVWQVADTTTASGRAVRLYTVDIRLGEVLADPEFGRWISEALAATNEDLSPGAVNLFLGGLVFQLREELNEATFHLEYAISPEDMYIYDFSLALDVTVNIGFLRAFVGELEFEIVKLGTAVDLSIGEYNASYEILPPPGVETSSTPPKGTSRFNDTRFANFAGIPFDQGIITTRTVVKAEDVVDGVVQGINTDGIPYIGSPSAPIVIAEFSDFSCPHCANFAPTVDLMVARYVRSGQLRLEYYPLTFVGREFSVNAASAAICAGQQGAFWEYHLELYEWLQTRGAQSFVPDELVKLAGEFELDIDQFELCLASNLPAITLETARRLQQDNGVNATPTLIYRTNTDTTWSRFVDANGNSLTRPSDDELFQIIESYNNNK